MMKQPNNRNNYSIASESNSHIRVSYTTREIPRSPIARKSVVMGTVWLFKPSSTHTFQQLCTSRMVERFGKDETNWEHVELDFISEDEELAIPQTSTETNCELMSDGSEEPTLSSYEIERQRRIEENRL